MLQDTVFRSLIRSLQMEKIYPHDFKNCVPLQGGVGAVTVLGLGLQRVNDKW